MHLITQYLSDELNKSILHVELPTDIAGNHINLHIMCILEADIIRNNKNLFL